MEEESQQHPLPGQNAGRRNQQQQKCHHQQQQQGAAPASPYRGTQYRSVAFGTWAVGDASRRFEEQRKRGRSSGGEKDEGEEMMRQRREGGGGDRESPSTKPAATSPVGKSTATAAAEPSSLSHSLGDIRQQRRLRVAPAKMMMGKQSADLYSSTDYVRHSDGREEEGEAGGGGQENGLPFFPLSPPCNHRSLETLHLVPPSLLLHQPSCSSPVPSRISCPPSRHHHHRFAFIVDPLKATANRGGGGTGGGMRNRTKSLDNGLKFSLGGRHRKDRIGGGEEGGTGMMGSSGEIGTKKGGGRGTPIDRRGAAAAASRLDQAKQFLRRFYASSTMRLASGRRRWRKEAAPMEQQQADNNGPPPPPSGALMYSSAMGPFFEFRRPCAEELPLLPYNIHYAVESPPDCSSSDDSEEEEEEEDWAESRTDGREGGGGMNGRPIGNAGGGGDQSTGGGGADDASSTLTPASASSPASSSSASSSSTSSSHSARNSSSSGLAVSDLAILDSSSLEMHKFSAAATKLAAHSPDSGIGPSESAVAGRATMTAVASTPLSSSSSAGSSRSSTSEGKKTAPVPTGGGPAERRFANWNELFQYLRREIVEMNVRDAQILHRLEGIQAELNGVRQMKQKGGGNNNNMIGRMA